MSNFVHNSRVDRVPRQARARMRQDALICIFRRQNASGHAGKEIVWLAVCGTEKFIASVELPEGTLDVIGLPRGLAVVLSVPVAVVHVVLLIEQRASRVRFVENMLGLIVRAVDVIVSNKIN